MFSNVTVNPSAGSGVDRDSKFPGALARLAKQRLNSNPTDDVHAAFKEGERSPVREAGGMST